MTSVVSRKHTLWSGYHEMLGNDEDVMSRAESVTRWMYAGIRSSPRWAQSNNAVGEARVADTLGDKGW